MLGDFHIAQILQNRILPNNRNTCLIEKTSAHISGIWLTYTTFHKILQNSWTKITRYNYNINCSVVAPTALARKL